MPRTSSDPHFSSNKAGFLGQTDHDPPGAKGSPYFFGYSRKPLTRQLTRNSKKAFLILPFSHWCRDSFPAKTEDSLIAKNFNIIQRCPDHTFQILTKHLMNLTKIYNHFPKNLWLGVTVNKNRDWDQVHFLTKVLATFSFNSDTLYKFFF